MFVFFLDLLGFASAVSQLSEQDEQALLQGIQSSGASGRPIQIELASQRAQKLFDNYKLFRERAQLRIRKLESDVAEDSTQPLASVRTVVFSDSLFIACENLGALVIAGTHLYTDLLLAGPVACRGGLARGAFVAPDWTIRAGEGKRFHAEAPFLGSGVVNAYYAESKSGMGPRLLIHDSALPDVRNLAGTAAIDLEVAEQTTDVHAELNLFYEPLIDGAHPCDGYPTMKRHLAALKGLAPASLHARYDATLAAMERMCFATDSKLDLPR